MRAWMTLLAGAALMGLVACGQTSDTTEGGSEAPAADTAAAEAPATGSPSADGATATPTGTPGALEVGFDRPGYDHRTEYGVADAEACRDLCQADAECLSFTWVQAGIQAETPICWLKDQVPGQVEAEWATSGVMVDRSPPAGE